MQFCHLLPQTGNLLLEGGPVILGLLLDAADQLQQVVIITLNVCHIQLKRGFGLF
ncbi:hypothetical protein D3C74_409530 [compost metagenome]